LQARQSNRREEAAVWFVSPFVYFVAVKEEIIGVVFVAEEN